MKAIFLILTCICFVSAYQACGQRQGIKGEILWLSGNQMPGPGRAPSPGLGVKREIHVYQVATLQDAEQMGSLYISIKTERVATAFSREDGTFKIKLPPGTYSIFVKEPNGRLFANLLNDKGQISAVVVEPGKFSWLPITVDYEAAY